MRGKHSTSVRARLRTRIPCRPQPCTHTLDADGWGRRVGGGAVAALAYALYCDEMQAPFLAIWYVLGMGIPAAVGWVVGPRLLRW